MLYDRWQQTMRERRRELALRDLATGREFTFAQLDAAAGGPRTPARIAFPQGARAEFVLSVLRAWRRGQVVCPLETSQQPPALDSLPEWCAHLKTTSASTGPARLIAFTAEQLVADAAQIVDSMRLRPEQANLGVISLAHSYGFSNLVLPLLLHGIPLVLAGSALPEAVRVAAEDAGEITLPAVPALWRAWQDTRAIPENIRLAISAGAHLPLSLEQAVFETRGLKIHNFYGASECGGIAYDATEAPRAESACAGKPMRGVELALASDGCLEVYSRAVAQTYWPVSDAALGQGRFIAGDLAELRDGQVLLRGRANDQINVAGRKVSPETIERALLRHPHVRECLVFGAPHSGPERAETIVACVACEPSINAGLLREFLLQELPAWQAPREWLFFEKLPANERGKWSRAEWRRRFVAQHRGDSCS